MPRHDQGSHASTPLVAVGAAIAGTAVGTALHRRLPTTAFGGLQRVWVPALAGVIAGGAGIGAMTGINAARAEFDLDPDLADAALGATGLAAAVVLSRGSAATRSNPVAFGRAAGMALTGAAVADAGIRHGSEAVEDLDLIDGGAATAAATGLVVIAGAAAGYAAARRIHALNPTFTGELAFGHQVGARAAQAEPITPLATVSLGADSLIPTNTIGTLGIKFLKGAIPAEKIAAATGRPAVDPVRAFVGVKSAAPGADRVDLLRQEIRRLGVIGGANHRSTIVMVSPAGAFTDYVATDARELLAGGDVAHLAIAWSNKPALQSGGKVREGIDQFRKAIAMVREEIDALPPEQRPKLEVYGESIGALVGQQAILKQGIAGLDAMGIDRAVFVGAPSGGRAQRSLLAAEAATDAPRAMEYAGLDDLLARSTPELREGLRVHLLKHPEDAVSNLRPRRIWQATPIPEGSVVRNQATHIPAVSFAHMMGDVVNFQTPPGRLGMRGHNYGGDMAGVLRQLHPDVEDAQMPGIVGQMRRSEADRHLLVDVPDLPPAFTDGSTTARTTSGDLA